MIRLAALLVLSLLAAGCAGPRQAVRTPVPDNINARFLSDDLDVDGFVGRWELESREVYGARHELLDAMGLEPGMTVADIGTGTGLFVEGMAEAVGPGGRVLAVDISPRFCFHVRERARKLGLDQVEVMLSTARSTELPANSVDVAFLCDVYHHFEYHEDMLRSLKSALKPGGRLVLVDFHRIEGVSREWLLGHVRAGKEVFRAEVEAAGFTFENEVASAELEENYCLRFRAL